MSIATEITRLQTAKANLKTSLEAKGATIASDATIDTYPTVLDDIPVCTLQDKQVTVSAGSTTTISPDNGYTGLHEVEVTADNTPAGTLYFYDYDGTLVESYTGASIQALSALPSAPDHSQDEVPLTFEEWNWTLSEIKAYNTSYPEADINVGATYHTTDGKAHFYWNITTDNDGNGVEIALELGDGTVDWGDGSAVETITSTTISHVYTSVGLFNCIVSSTSSYFTISGGSSTRVGKREKLVKCFFPNTITSIENNAFNSCASFKLITIPNTVTSIGNNAFNSCESLKLITIPDGVTSIGDNAFDNCRSLQLVTIPNGVTRIVSYTFNSCYSLQSITIPDGVTSIGYSAFCNCFALQSITIPDGVTSIEGTAFSGCSALRSIVIPSSVTNIDGQAFSSCRLIQSIIIPDGVTSIEGYTFYYCFSLQSITIPSSIRTIRTYAFQQCFSLQSITIPSGVTSIESYAFSSCASLQSITIPNTVTSIGNYAFSNCTSLQSITIPNTVTSIGTYILSNCHSLQSITIPSSVTSIGNNAFSGCSSLQSITIPSSVTSIGNTVFNGCYSCYTVTILATTPPTLGTTVFNTSYQKKIYVPYSADHSILAAYQSDTNWVEYASIMEELPE